MMVFLLGCEPDVESLAELRSQNATEDLALYNEGKAKDYGALTVEQAVELSLQYNLNLWLSRQEQAIAQELKNSALLKMLPQFNFDIAGNGRDTPNASSSVGLFTGQQAQLTTYSYSAAEQGTTWGFGMLWNVMDFGVSYFRWQQSAKEVAIAKQGLQRARQNVIFDTRMAFWQALTLEAVVNKAKAIESEIDQKLQDINKRVASGDMAGNQVYDTKYRLMKYKQGLINYEENFKIARAELARTMGLPLGAKFTLAGSLDAAAAPQAGAFADTTELEKTALLNRPELVQEDLKEKISHTDARLALLQMLPTPTMLLRHNDDDNKYLYYSSWTSWGMDVSWNLLAAPSRFMEFRGHQKRAEFVKKKRMAMAVAVLTQLHIALIDFDHVQRQYQLSAEMAATIGKAVEAHQQNLGKGENFTESQLLEKKVQEADEFAVRMNLLAKLLTAQARICNTMGVDSAQERAYAGTSAVSPKIEANLAALQKCLAGEADRPEEQGLAGAAAAVLQPTQNAPAAQGGAAAAAGQEAAAKRNPVEELPDWNDENVLSYEQAKQLDLQSQGRSAALAGSPDGGHHATQPGIRQ